MRGILSELLMIIGMIVITVIVTVTLGTGLVGVGALFGQHFQNVYSSQNSS